MNPKPKIKNVFISCVTGALFFLCTGIHADWQYGGNTKYQITHTQNPSDSTFALAGATQPTDHNLTVRLTAENTSGAWDIRLHYEAAFIYAETLDALPSLPVHPLLASLGPASDTTRWFNLTSVIYFQGRQAVVHRLDRASIGYTTDNYVFRIGRHAVSWGNGMVFNPIDIFNPFSPTAIDKEYKSGDDIIYGQLLLASGNDLQGIIVPRRNVGNGSLDQNRSSVAIKYHGTRGTIDYDLLAARHYAENLVAGGTAFDWKGAIIRADVVVSNGSGSTVASGVTSVNYSWVWAKHNVTGYLEYYRNGYGISDSNYSLTALNANTALLERLSRGELYVLGRDYIAGGLTVELTPRWMFMPSLIYNLNDGSAQTQFFANYDWKQNASFMMGANIPFGANGTEYGGIPDDSGGFFGPGISIIARVAYYF